MNESRRRSNVVLLIADLEIVDKHHIFFNKYELKKEVELRWSPSKPSFGSALLAPGLAVGRRLRGALRQLRTRWRLPAAPLSAKMAATSGASCPSTATLCHGFT